jgi:probable F420-dependent oxidoreductase
MDAEQQGKRAIRFGLQVSPTPDTVQDVASEAEALGFDVISVADHIGPGSPPPLTVMTQLLGHTTSITVGSLVLNNDMRNPVQLAWDVAWLQNAHPGRVELGLGAGHTPQEYGATGVERADAASRKRRLAESVEIIIALFRDEVVDFDGECYSLVEAQVDPPLTPVPILVGGNGDRLLSHAAVHADIIGLQGLGRIREDGYRHAAKFQIDHLEAQLATIAGAAVERSDGRPHLQALVQVVDITDDREKALAAVLERVEGLTLDDALLTPYLAVGTVDELARQFVEARDRWGISYFTVRSPELAPVIARVAELEALAATGRP